MSIGKAKNSLGKPTFEKISHRMAVLERLTGKSPNTLGKEAGLSNTTADDWSDNQIGKPTRTVRDFLKHHRISEQWWQTGEGEVFITSDQKATDNKEKMESQEEVYRNIVEGNTEYILIPRSVLQEKYRLVALEQFQKDKEQMDKDKAVIDKLLDMNEKLIAEITSLKAKVPEVQKA